MTLPTGGSPLINSGSGILFGDHFGIWDLDHRPHVAPIDVVQPVLALAPGPHRYVILLVMMHATIQIGVDHPTHRADIYSFGEECGETIRLALPNPWRCLGQF